MNVYFTRQNHFNYKVLFAIVYFIFFTLVTWLFIRDRTIYYIGIIFLILLFAMCLFATILLNSFGLYLVDGQLYLKRIKQHKIDIKSIVAIKIVKSEIDDKFGKRDLKDFCGNNLYSMVFLSNITQNMIKYANGDMTFMHEFSANSICCVVYDEIMIKYLQQINNDIEII